MALIERTTEAGMIATFLAAGLGSRRTGEPHLGRVLAVQGLEESLVTTPDLSDRDENRRREELLAAWYGWGTTESLFGGLPADDVEWWRGTIRRELLPRVEVIQWLVDEWPDGFPGRALRQVHGHNRERWREGGPVADIAAAIGAGHAVPPPIVITTPARARVVILDGHTRLCALMHMGEAAPPFVPVVAGVTARAAEWSEW